MALRDAINNFRQKPNEALYEAWDRFKKMLAKCPNHMIMEVVLLQTFYRGLTPACKNECNSICGSPVMSLTWTLISVCLDQHAKIERAWHTRDAEVARGAPSASSSAAMSRKDEERDELMAKMATQLELLTKQVMGPATNKVHVVDTQPDVALEEEQFQAMYEEEVKFAANVGGFQPRLSAPRWEPRLEQW